MILRKSTRSRLRVLLCLAIAAWAGLTLYSMTASTVGADGPELEKVRYWEGYDHCWDISPQSV